MTSESSIGSISLTWKDKILDYEIEIDKGHTTLDIAFAWKDKILDYEIEIVAP